MQGGHERPVRPSAIIPRAQSLAEQSICQSQRDAVEVSVTSEATDYRRLGSTLSTRVRLTQGDALVSASGGSFLKSSSPPLPTLPFDSTCKGPNVGHELAALGCGRLCPTSPPSQPSQPVKRQTLPHGQRRCHTSQPVTRELFLSRGDGRRATMYLCSSINKDWELFTRRWPEIDPLAVVACLPRRPP